MSWELSYDQGVTFEVTLDSQIASINPLRAGTGYRRDD